VDQFEMHLRAVLDLPCPQPFMKVPVAAMLNVLGVDGDMNKVLVTLRTAAGVPGCAVHWYGKSECRAGRKMAHITITANSVSILRERLELLGVAAECHGLPLAGPRVGIVMGSDSDLRVMKGVAEMLDAFGVRYELTIVSAHRTPTRMFTYAQTAVERGLEVLVAGAGGAAHLPGMIAALTTLPVIGVPVSSAAYGGNDALLSIVQMPRGVPVATVAIDNGTNGGLLALRILACRDPALRAQLETYTSSQEGEVLAKADHLEAVGFNQYMKEMGK
jgi:phosphoribosylaminoimidazole carboxylase